MKKIKVTVGRDKDDSYEIRIGRGLLGRIAGELDEADVAHSLAVVTDSNVAGLYAGDIVDGLRTRFAKVELVVFPAGEKSKNRETKSFIEDRMLDSGFGRDSCVVALGGGVVGDVAGFVAATYMRGIPCVQVPTSLVACVDSSVGGKTAVDTPHGKNLVGAFHQPWRVYADTDVLKTLGRREICEGLAETIKYGVIESEELFRYLEENVEKVHMLDDRVLREVIEASCEIKARVVGLDEKERNLRKILNFGHTAGHALEQLSGYELSHGEAISIGMTVEGEIALGETSWSEREQNRLKELLRRAGLPTDCPRDVDIRKITDVMKMDKKARGGKIEMALPARVGEMEKRDGNYGTGIGEEKIKSVLGALRRE